MPKHQSDYFYITNHIKDKTNVIKSMRSIKASLWTVLLNHQDLVFAKERNGHLTHFALLMLNWFCFQHCIICILHTAYWYPMVDGTISFRDRPLHTKWYISCIFYKKALKHIFICLRGNSTALCDSLWESVNLVNWMSLLWVDILKWKI